MQQKTLYVGNLNFRATSADVSELFSSFGKVVSVKLIEKDGKKKGFGFVEFEDVKEAQTAKEKLSQQDFMGRKLVVDFARPPKQRNYAS